MHLKQVEKRTEEGDNVSAQNEEVSWNAGSNMSDNKTV